MPLESCGEYLGIQEKPRPWLLLCQQRLVAAPDAKQRLVVYAVACAGGQRWQAEGAVARQTSQDPVRLSSPDTSWPSLPQLLAASRLSALTACVQPGAQIAAAVYSKPAQDPSSGLALLLPKDSATPGNWQQRTFHCRYCLRNSICSHISPARPAASFRSSSLTGSCSAASMPPSRGKVDDLWHCASCNEPRLDAASSFSGRWASMVLSGSLCNDKSK